MSLFSGPSEHAANPPETWKVRHAGERLWQIVTASGDVLNSYVAKDRAEQDLAAGWLVEQYAADGRWYAGETPDGATPWERVRAEKANLMGRIARRGRDEQRRRVEQLTGWLRGDQRALTPELEGDTLAWARDYVARYPVASESKRMAGTLAMIDDALAEVARMDALATDYAAA